MHLNRLGKHYAEEKRCRPPEMEFTGMRSFLQILADHQVDGQDHSIIQPSAASSQLGDPLEATLAGYRRWWHVPVSQLSPLGTFAELQGPHREAKDVNSRQTALANVDPTTRTKNTRSSRPGGTWIRETLVAPQTATASSYETLPHMFAPPECPICIQPLMKKEEVLATACG